jgi:hypothetical protein
MPAPILNKQPIFTATPVLTSKKVTLATPNSLYNVANAVDIYVDATTYGTLINRITVSADGILSANIPATTIYLFVYDSTNASYNLYKSAVISAVASVGYQEVPSVQFTFDGGLVLSPNTKLALGSTDGDVNYAVVVEGGTYDLATV